MILPGSNRVKGLHHGDSFSNSAVVGPVSSAVRSSSSTTPACDTTPVPVASTGSAECDDVDLLTRGVLLELSPFGPFASRIFAVQAAILII